MTGAAGFQDCFSHDPAAYARHRPTYPRELFDQLAALAPGRSRAWDCATGNGQAALALAERFALVVATDASPAQLACARPHPRVRYLRCLAEQPALAARRFELVTVAQALHWFRVEDFAAAAQRALVPGGVLAAWCYDLHAITPAVDRVVRRLYRDVVGPYWRPARALVEERYASLVLSAGGRLEELPTASGAATAHWNLGELLSYLGTWSAVRLYREERGADPLEHVASELRTAWGPAARRRTIRWPLGLRVLRCRG